MSDENQIVSFQPQPLPGNELRGRQNALARSVEISEIDAFGQFRALWDLLIKHQWLIVAVTIVLTTAVAIYSFKMKPVYQAVSRVDVESEAPLLQTLDELFKTGDADDAFLATQVSILKSDELAWDTIQKLGLGGVSNSKDKVIGIPESQEIAAVRGFQGNLFVEREKETRMVLVKYESTSPNLAATAVNALVNNYVEYNFQTKYDASRQATGWMEQRLDELKLKVEKSEQAMVDYERQNNIVSVDDKETVAEARLNSLNSSLSAAQADRLSKESTFRMIQENEANVGFIATPGSLLNSLESKEMDLKEQFSAAAAQYGPTYPRALAIQDQLTDLNTLISRERKRAVDSVREDYEASAQREKAISEAVAEQKGEVDRVNQLLIEHNLLKREFETNQQLYDSLLTHLKDANVSAGLRATNIHVIDRAVPPTTPIRPDRMRNIIFAIAAGLGLGIGLALTREALDNSIKSAQEIEKLTDLPTLAIVPITHVYGAETEGSQGLKGFRTSTSESRAAAALSVIKKPGAPISEAYRALRTSVLLSTADHPPQVLLVTSSQPGEGKTVTALNLALTMSQKGGRVLLVDADMRRPGIAKALKISLDKGLSGILTGAYDYGSDLLYRIESAEWLSLLPSGPIPPNPAELLCSMKMDGLIKNIRKDFDHVIIDSPPVLPITDATILSSLVDGVLMVVECEMTTRAALTRACRVIEHSGGKIIGTVLNKVDVRRDGYYGYRYYHGYYTYSNKSYYAEDGNQPE